MALLWLSNVCQHPLEVIIVPSFGIRYIFIINYRPVLPPIRRHSKSKALMRARSKRRLNRDRHRSSARLRFSEVYLVAMFRYLDVEHQVTLVDPRPRELVSSEAAGYLYLAGLVYLRFASAHWY